MAARQCYARVFNDRRLADCEVVVILLGSMEQR